ncbi:MAG: cob(I)alamin adenosyltransferase [Pseudohongiellaceae bacterium]|jgi:cob(I)alamin adenosyltransferase
MVRLNKIYTRGGDQGSTALGDGTRVPKTSVRIEAYGTVDELNAVVGQLLDHALDKDERAGLGKLQHDLFDLGADLCVPTAEPVLGADGEPEPPVSRLRITQAAIDNIESWIDQANESLAPLTTFVLPGGTPLSSGYHVARTVCRRAERRLLQLLDAEPDRVNALGLVYLNRLSDLFFVLGRVAAGDQERLWIPGGGLNQ